MDQDLVSFVIRFVREAGEDQEARWRGVIKHVQSNSQAGFTQFSDALAFMQGFVNDVAQSGFSQSKGFTESYGMVNPFLETTRLWGDFMPPYAKSMMESMGEMMGGKSAQGETMPGEQATDKTLAAWGLPTRSEQTQLTTTLEALTQQLAEMTAKLADLENQIKQFKVEK